MRQHDIPDAVGFGQSILSDSLARRPGLLLLLLLLLLPLPGMAAPCAQQNAAILAPIHIVDVEHGRVRRHRGLLISEGRIVSEFRARHTAQFARRYPAALRIDGAGAYAMPGLFDMHVHALWDAQVAEPFLREFLRQGITSVRDMGGVLEIASHTRAAIHRCDYLAPNLWYAGTFLDGPEPVDPAMSLALANPAQARTAVRQLHRSGVDFLKVYSMLAPELLEVVLDEATTLGLPVVGHVPATAPTSTPVFRLASVEHLAIEVGGICPSARRRTCGPILRRLVRHRVAQTPTLIAREVSTRIAQDGFVDPPAFAALPAVVQAYWSAERSRSVARASAAWQADRATSMAHSRWLLRALSRQGAILLAGSDAGTPYLFPGTSLHEELALLVQSGLAPRQALMAATEAPARFLRRDDLGRLKPGAVADLVLLDGNPLQDIMWTRAIRAVFRAGIRVAR